MSPNGIEQLESSPLVELRDNPQDFYFNLPGEVGAGERMDHMGEFVGAVGVVVDSITTHDLRREPVVAYDVKGQPREVPDEAAEELLSTQAELERAVGRKALPEPLDDFRIKTFTEASQEIYSRQDSRQLMGGLAVFHTDHGFEGGVFALGSLNDTVERALNNYRLVAKHARDFSSIERVTTRASADYQKRHHLNDRGVVDFMLKTAIAAKLPNIETLRREMEMSEEHPTQTEAENRPALVLLTQTAEIARTA